MDKKNTIIGILLFVAAFVLMMNQQQPTREPIEPPAGDPSQQQTGPQTPQPTPSPAGAAPDSGLQPVPQAAPGQMVQADDAILRESEQVVTLENPLIEANFSTLGGAIKSVALKDFARTKGSEERYIINRLHETYALALKSPTVNYNRINYEIYSQSGDSVTFRAVLEDKLEVYRRYTISQTTKGPAPYLIRHEIEFRNLTATPLSTGDFGLNLGTFTPDDKQGQYFLSCGYYDGDDTEFIKGTKFTGGGFLFFRSDPKSEISETLPIHWASAKNQFFTTILSPDEPGRGILSYPVVLPADDPEIDQQTGITGQVLFDAVVVPADGSAQLGFDYYAGPKEHSRISKLDKNQEDAIDFGFTGAISKFLLLMLRGLHAVAGNWGLAIILLTLVVRTILLPINLVSSKSMKRMSKLAEPMKQVKETFPDNQQKQQQMMMELYKLNKVNPVAGCLPLLLQMPIFFGLFYMLRSAAELRFREFLWIRDLSSQEAIFIIPNVPIFGDLPFNLLPFLMTITMAYQMRMMPTPSVDNTQAKMLKFMPYIFFPITYTFASGLVLYWTVSNIFTIGQTWLINRRHTDFEVVLPPALKKASEGAKKKGRKKKKQAQA